jgi:hypothetical protein
MIAQSGMKGTHAGGRDLAKDDGGEGPSIGEDKPMVINAVTIEIFLPFEVGEQCLVEFE